jgi:RNA polymerase sigma-70 factor, ECF subfamily
MDASPWDPEIAGLVKRARAAFPEFVVNPALFAQHLMSCAKAAGAAGAASLHAEDLYLAFAAAHQDRRALMWVDQRYLAQVGQFIVHLRKPQSFVDEVRQRLRERMLFGAGGPPRRGPRILDYSGRGPLVAWLKVTAMRQALDLIESEKQHSPLNEEHEDDLLAATANPELVAIRQRHLPQFQEAFRAALASLDARERNLLRLYLVDGLNIGRIGEIFGKSRATIGRMVIDCRMKLLEETRSRLGVLTGASEGDVLSLIRVLQSQLDVSIGGFLRRTG